MTRSILTMVGFAVAVMGNAQAAEVQGPQDPTTRIVKNRTWTGFYAGLNIGGGFGGTNIRTTGQATANVNNVNGGARPALTSVDRKGIIGGGQVGYNHQLGKMVLGFEADFSGSSIDGKRTVTTTALTGGASLNNNFSSNLTYIGTARGRVGYTLGRTLLYGTGGLAYAGSEQTAGLFGPSTANVLQFTGNNSGMKKGYVVGGGGEYAMSRKFSIKAEYLYYDLGQSTLNVAVIAGSGGGGTGYNSSFENKGNLVRAGVNYRF